MKAGRQYAGNCIQKKKKKKVNIAPSIRNTFCLVGQSIFKSLMNEYKARKTKPSSVHPSLLRWGTETFMPIAEIRERKRGDAHQYFLQLFPGLDEFTCRSFQFRSEGL